MSFSGGTRTACQTPAAAISIATEPSRYRQPSDTAQPRPGKTMDPSDRRSRIACMGAASNTAPIAQLNRITKARGYSGEKIEPEDIRFQ
jgi:hypothetical protein